MTATATETKTCGAFKDGMVCTLPEHSEGTRHLDETQGSQYHSASWR